MKRIVKTALYVALAPAVLLLAAAVAGCCLYLSADFTPPPATRDFADSLVRTLPDGSRAFGASRLRHSGSGLWELHLAGDAEQRGAAFGALADSLIREQERVFVDQIRRLIPHRRYLGLLRCLTVAFNRRLTEHIPTELCAEIAALSRYCTHEYDFIGEPYLRQLNYHAAHDIGHAMQEYMLVGCTSFGAWGAAAGGGMIVGRNFDFYAGDDFARNRMVTFCRPDSGYRFAAVGWPGMVGVLSGMNEKGLTVTLNAAKGPVPLGSATPVSILARTILQYASTLDEAWKIASQYRLFVSESFLVGSARDGRCAVIEKTPRKQALYTAPGETIGCTNHFQSEAFARDPQNAKNAALTDSGPRLERLTQLLDGAKPLTVEKAVAILRDRRSSDGRDLGLANPMAINQQIAHHSVVFEPLTLRMWISTAHWGMGEWVCYDLHRMLCGEAPGSGESYVRGAVIAADTLFARRDLGRLQRYRRLRSAPEADRADSLPASNPSNWESWAEAGRCYRSRGEHARARECLRRALELPMPEGERRRLEKSLKKR